MNSEYVFCADLGTVPFSLQNTSGHSLAARCPDWHHSHGLHRCHGSVELVMEVGI